MKIKIAECIQVFAIAMVSINVAVKYELAAGLVVWIVLFVLVDILDAVEKVANK